MRVRTLFRQIAREARGARGRVIFFILCLAVGVGAVVAVAGFSASLRATLSREARQLLAADLRVRGQQPVPAAVDELLAAEAAAGVRATRLTEMVTVAAAPQASAGAGRSQLVELKAVDGEFPFWTSALGFGLPHPMHPSFQFHPLLPLFGLVPPSAAVRILCAVHGAVGATGCSSTRPTR